MERVVLSHHAYPVRRIGLSVRVVIVFRREDPANGIAAMSTSGPQIIRTEADLGSRGRAHVQRRIAPSARIEDPFECIQRP